MATTVAQPVEKTNYLNADYGIKSWLLTTDHKRIALLYLASVTFFFFIGGFFAMLIRLELLTPAGDLMQADTYNKVFTMHGVIMVFFFLIPSIPAVLGNFLVPLMVGAKDLAFPKINLLSWYLYMIGGAFALYGMINGGVDTGWTFYTPFSTTYSNTNVSMVAIGVFIAGFSSIFTGLNFIVTIHRMRAPGMTWFRMPLFVWSNYAASILMVLGTPVLAITLVLVVLERTIHIGVFDPTLGGDPLLFQHLFWFYSHPAVYIMIRLGTPHVHHGRVELLGAGLLAADHARRGSFRHQGLQLGLHDAEGFDHLRDADALRTGFHWPIHHRRPYGRLSWISWNGYSPHRDVLHRRALPLRDGGRYVDGVPRRRPLLVAEDGGSHVSGVAFEALGG